MPSLISLADVGAALAGLGALSTASFGLLDVSKGLWGGVSNVGSEHLKRGLAPFAPALAAALGADAWWPVVRANWVAGVGKTEQKMKVQALIKLGLSPQTAPQIAQACHVDPKALTAVAAKLETGRELTDADLNVLGRMSAVIDALMDAAFEAADQKYRNVCRLLAGVVAIALSYFAWLFWPEGDADRPDLRAALAVGLLAVPLAPVAKDLTSALSAAMQALKATRGA